HRAARAGRELALTAREFDLLCFLLQHPGRVFSREELMHEVWGWSFGDRSTVTVHVRRLREKIEDDPAAPKMLVTVWGVGYRLDAGGLGDDGGDAFEDAGAGDGPGHAGHAVAPDPPLASLVPPPSAAPRPGAARERP
ncbi:MAG: winged helix-turn-helix transcriptional regulator, partial [Streptomycetaceae bacterium]|nr:winged helix-turn-helix transcriptional regulator [Streptomycetaceae bacterium]